MLLDLKQCLSAHELNIRGVIHIGAHFGEELAAYKELAIEHLIMFEPVQSTFSILKERVADNAILVNKALGNFNGKTTMNIASNESASSSILQPEHHLQQYREIRFDTQEEVDVVRLDDFLATEQRKNYNLMNIDVQGYELEVLKGACETLINIDAIMTEVNLKHLYTDCVLIEELDAYLLSFGFERHETTWDGVTWGDAFYVKKRTAQ